MTQSSPPHASHSTMPRVNGANAHGKITSIAGKTPKLESTTDAAVTNRRFALKKLIQKANERRDKNATADAPDPLGEEILSLLLRASQNENLYRRPPQFQWTPVFSHHNWCVFRTRLSQFIQSDGCENSSLVETGTRMLRAVARIFVNDNRPTPWSSLIFLCRAVLCCAVVVAVGTTCLLVWSTRILYRVVRSLLLALVDWDAIRQSNEATCSNVESWWKGFYTMLDSFILQRHRFQGRDWNTQGFILEPPTSRGELATSYAQQSTNRTVHLWDLPPPRTSRPLHHWSRRTMQHIEAIDYCYMMLEYEHNNPPKKKALVDKSVSDGVQNQNGRHMFDRHDAAHNHGSRHLDVDDPANLSVEIEATSSTIRVREPGCDDMPDDSFDADATSDGNMDWIDVGTKIGMRFLHSEHVHRAMAAQEAKEREASAKLAASNLIAESEMQATSTSEVEAKIPKPVHSMWTSPNAAAAGLLLSTSSYVEQEEVSFSHFPQQQLYQTQSFPGSATSPRSLMRKVAPRKTTNLEPLKDESPPRRIAPPSHKVSRSDIPNVAISELSDTRQSKLLSALGQTERPSGLARQKSSVRVCRAYRRAPLQPGVKVAVPIFPCRPGELSQSRRATFYQIATVVRSCRIFVGDDDNIGTMRPCDGNCLSVTVKLEKFFLRNGEFGEMTFRVLDTWSPRYMPRHSKVPIGSCIATSYGVGVLVGWRVEDDCHVVRSLWQCRGPGSAYAYLNRDSIHSTTAAAVGFRVQTLFGWGAVLACVHGGLTFEHCRYYVEIREEGRHKGNVLELDQKEVLSCHGAQFLPIIEHIRAAALYQIQLDNYNAALREQHLDESAPSVEQEILHTWVSCAEILWNGFLKAVEEDKDFDDGVNEFMTTVINFLDRLDSGNSNQGSSTLPSSAERNVSVTCSDDIEVQLSSNADEANHEPGFWIMNDLFGGVFKTDDATDKRAEVGIHQVGSDDERPMAEKSQTYFDRAFAVLRTLLKTVSIARASCDNHPHFRLALAITYDVLLFARTIVKVQQRNTSGHSLKVWKRAWDEIVSTFGPIKERLESIGRGIARRMEHQGRKAKIRVLKFVDHILGDERLLFALEQGEWERCLARLEVALVEAEVIEDANLIYYRKAAKFVFDHLQMATEQSGGGGAATRSSEKLAILAYLVQSMASPRRSVLKVFCRDDVMELFERILVRAYYKEEIATRMLTIHAANFHSLRHLRMLKDFSVSGRIWIPLLDAADEELSWLVSTLPENSKGIMCPLSSLFSLCVAQFHKIIAGDFSRDWLSFLLEDDSVRIIHDIDMLLILALEAFSRDISEMLTVLPYYPSIDDDILNLMDEVNVDEFLREASTAIDDPDKLSAFIRDKAIIAIERFLNYLPKMSIPVEKRELSDGWVLSCHGEDGGGLTLTDVTIKRENLVCQIMGGDTLFFPMFAESEPESATRNAIPKAEVEPSVAEAPKPTDEQGEESVLDHIKLLIMNAQQHGCWKPGVGGVGQPPTDRYAASVFQGVPVSKVLNCSIDLWRNLELDDDELLEIAIRDISYHIELQKEKEKSCNPKVERQVEKSSSGSTSMSESTSSSAAPQKEPSPTVERQRHRFNPRVDPTVLFLEIKRLTLNLDNFYFRIEKGEKKTIFDPVFAGRGVLSLQNVSIRLRVECAKERVKKPELGIDISTPILQLRDLEVSLDKLQMTVTDTGFGSDWILNKAVEVFEEKLTEVVEANLKDQIQEQAQNAIESLNSYFLMNPSLLLVGIGVSMEDLDENVVWV